MLICLAVIFFFIFLVSIIGEKRAFTVFFAFCVIGCQYKILGPFTIEDALILLFLLMSINNVHFGQNARKYPLYILICTLMFSLSIMLSSIFTQTIPHYGLALSSCLRITLLPFLFSYYIRTNQDIHYVVKFLIVITVFGFVLSFVSILLQENLYLNFLRVLFGEKIGWDRIAEKRFGFSRAQAFCLQPVSYGYICMTICSVFLLFVHKFKNIIGVSDMSMISILFFSVIGCFLSGSRSSLVPILVCLLFFYRNRIFIGTHYIYILAFLCVAFFLYGDYLPQILLSITDSNTNPMGSSTDMRIEQLEISLHYFAKSPLIGMGTYAIFDLVGYQKGETILGGESIWFSLLINQGLFGCITYIFMYIGAFLSLKGSKTEAFVFLSLQLLNNTLTSIPGYDASLFLCFILFAGKLNSLSVLRTNGFIMSNIK